MRVETCRRLRDYRLSTALYPSIRMKRRKVRLARARFCAKLTNETKALLWRTWRLARLETPGLTMGDLLHRMSVAGGIQVRRRLRAKGIDYSAITKPPARAKFTGPPPLDDGREYD